MHRGSSLVFAGATWLLACTAETTPEPTSASTPAPLAQREPAPPEPAPPEPAPPEPAPPAPALAELAPLPEHPGLALGPALVASEAQRREALLRLLSSGDAAQLPLVATDPQRTFDPELVDELAPAPIVTRHVPVPQVELRKPTVGPSYSPDIVRRIVRAHQGELLACYLEVLEDVPQTKGKLSLRWTITAEGTTDGVEIASGNLDAEVAECVKQAVAGWAFPKPTHGALDVTYPLEFTTK